MRARAARRMGYKRFTASTIAGIALFVGSLILCVFLAALFGSHSGEVAGALGNVIGGAIGAAGAGYAVYWTLTSQREDETEKICTAINMEIAQLARFPLEQLAMCHAITAGHRHIPRADLPVFMQTPAPTLYMAAAERISRVHRPALAIAFYTGLVETEKCVNVIMKAPLPIDHILRGKEVKGLGVILMQQCFLVRQILSEAPIPSGQEQVLVSQMFTETVKRLDAQLSASNGVFPTVEEYESETEILDKP